MPFQEETDAYPMLLKVLQSVQDELANTSEPAQFASIQTGATPAVDHAGNGKDSCSDLIVSYLLHYPVGLDFEPDVTGGCGFTPAHDILVGVWRCAPEVKRTSNSITPPTPAAYLNNTRLILADMAAMKRGLCKALKGRDYLLRQWDAQGEQGNTVGGVWTVTVGPAS